LKLYEKENWHSDSKNLKSTERVNGYEEQTS